MIIAVITTIAIWVFKTLKPVCPWEVAEGELPNPARPFSSSCPCLTSPAWGPKTGLFVTSEFRTCSLVLLSQPSPWPVNSKMLWSLSLWDHDRVRHPASPFTSRPWTVCSFDVRSSFYHEGQGLADVGAGEENDQVAHH